MAEVTLHDYCCFVNPLEEDVCFRIMNIIDLKPFCDKILVFYFAKKDLLVGDAWPSLVWMSCKCLLREISLD